MGSLRSISDHLTPREDVVALLRLRRRMRINSAIPMIEIPIRVPMTIPATAPPERRFLLSEANAVVVGVVGVADTVEVLAIPKPLPVSELMDDSEPLTDGVKVVREFLGSDEVEVWARGELVTETFVSLVGELTLGGLTLAVAWVVRNMGSEGKDEVGGRCGADEPGAPGAPEEPVTSGFSGHQEAGTICPQHPLQ